MGMGMGMAPYPAQCLMPRDACQTADGIVGGLGVRLGERFAWWLRGGVFLDREFCRPSVSNEFAICFSMTLIAVVPRATRNRMRRWIARVETFGGR